MLARQTARLYASTCLTLGRSFNVTPRRRSRMENAEPRVDVEKKPLSRYENIASVSGREERVKASIDRASRCRRVMSPRFVPTSSRAFLGNSDETSSTEVCEELELVLRAKERVERRGTEH